MIELELNNIKKNYGLKNILDEMSFEVKTGERVGIIGANGSGKSTILKIIKGEENSNAGTVNIRKMATIGYLKQFYKTEENDMIVKDFLMQSFSELSEIEKQMKQMENQMKLITDESELQKIVNKYGKIQEKYITLGGYEVEEKFSRICSSFKFDEKYLNKQYNLLSGGEKTVVNLAKILLKNPSILLLDEPTNHLDIETLEWLEKFLVSYKGTIVIVSHDRYFLDKVITKTILIENGKAKIYNGNYTYFLEEDERRTLAEFEVYKSQQKKIEKMKQSIKTLRQFGQLAGNEMFFKRAKSIEKRLEKMELVDKVVLEKKKINLDFKVSGRSGNDVLHLENLTKKYGEKVVLKNINFDIYWGEKVCLSGKNGSGKSTLIKMIMGYDNNYNGEIKIGTNVDVGYIPQEIKFKNENETILNYFIKNFIGTETEARRVLANFMFYKDDVLKKLSTLSGGEKVRLKLANLITRRKNLLILDEPTNHLDISTREILESTLLEYEGTILFVSHDRYFIKKVANRIIKI